MIFERDGSMLMGLKSPGERGIDTFGMGVITAFFQFSGKMPCSKETLTMWTNIVLILGSKDLITKLFIPSTPTDIDFKDFVTLITASSVTG